MYSIPSSSLRTHDPREYICSSTCPSLTRWPQQLNIFKRVGILTQDKEGQNRRNGVVRVRKRRQYARRYIRALPTNSALVSFSHQPRALLSLPGISSFVKVKRLMTPHAIQGRSIIRLQIIKPCKKPLGSYSLRLKLSPARNAPSPHSSTAAGSHPCATPSSWKQHFASSSPRRR